MGPEGCGGNHLDGVTISAPVFTRVLKENVLGRTKGCVTNVNKLLSSLNYYYTAQGTGRARDRRVPR